jgi:chromosome segregation ATPase
MAMAEVENMKGSMGSVPELAGLFQLLDRNAMFWRPRYLEPSAWTEHLPFAFWLMASHQPKVYVELGTHHGTSYFGFCQAVERLGLDTQCYAVDTWKGDEHAGFFDEKIFAKVNEHNKAHYSGFSRLVRSTFDEALPHFSDGSIDLLHIDGLHTLEAVTHDFESWLPKLSKRAVVIMHDSNVRERDFGVFKLVEALQERYPSFEFVHGHGLAVIGVGPSQTETLQKLYTANDQERLKRSVQEIFSRLGRACADTFELGEQKIRAGKLSEELSRKKKEVEDVKATLEKTKADLTIRTKDLSETRAKLQSHAEKSAVERGQLEERAKLHQELYAEAKDNLAKIRITLDEKSNSHGTRIEEFTRLEQKNARLNAELSEFGEQKARITKLSEELSRKKKELEDFKASSEKTKAELGARTHDLAGAHSRLQSEIDKKALELAQLEERSQLYHDLYGEAKNDLAKVRNALDEHLSSRERHVNEQARQEQANFLLEQMNAQLNADLSDREQRLMVLAEEAKDKSTKLEVVQSQLAKITNDRDNDLRALVQEREAHDAEVKGLRERLMTQERELSKQANRLRESAQASDQVEKQLQESLLNLKQQSDSQVDSLMSEIQQLKDQITARDEEVSELKQIIEERETANSSINAKLHSLESEIERKNVEAKRMIETEGLARQRNETFTTEIQQEIQQVRNENNVLNEELSQVKNSFAESVAENLMLNEMHLSSEAEIKRQNSEIQRLLKEQVASATQQGSDVQAAKSENNRLKLENKKLLAEVDGFNESIKQRFIELATLTEMLEAVSGNLKLEKENGKKLTEILSATDKKSVLKQGAHEQLVNELGSQLAKRDVQIEMLVAAEETAIKRQSEHEELVNELRNQMARQDAQLQSLVQKMADNASVNKFDDNESRRSMRIFSGNGKINGSEDRKLASKVRLMKRSGIFDSEWYLMQYPDVKDSGMDPAEHYLRFGAAEMRDPGPLFSTEAYNAAHPDVVDSNINPLIHYLNHGSKEGRKIEGSKNV